MSCYLNRNNKSGFSPFEGFCGLKLHKRSKSFEAYFQQILKFEAMFASEE